MSSACIFYPTSRKDAPSRGLKHAFNDARLSRRFEHLQSKMCECQTYVAGGLSESWSGQMACYRFFNNARVSLGEVIGLCTEVSPDAVAGRNILALIDGTSVSLECKRKNAPRWVGMGVVESNSTPGFFLYPSLLLDRDSGEIIGLGDISIFTKPHSPSDPEENRKGRYQRRLLPFEQKSSSVWMLVAGNTQQSLSGAASVTYVMDRGADIYESLSGILGMGGCDLIVRADSRRLASSKHNGKQEGIGSVVSRSPRAGIRKVKLRALCHRSKSSRKMVVRKAREAKLEIRYAKVYLSSALKKSSIKSPFWVVQARELASSPPFGEDPVEWTILTSIPVESMEDACGVLDSYCSRWWVEQLFRGLKKDGVDIERIELEDPEAIKKYTIMAMKASVEALRLVAARDGSDNAPASEIFSGKECEVLESIGSNLEGGTEKLRNPHRQDSLAWAAWIIARLGGWKGYQSQRPPGPATMSKGLEIFRNAVWMDGLMKDMYKP